MATDTIHIPGIDTPVSRVALGTWAIGGWMWGGPDDDNAVRTIHRALDEGISLIDTAPVYGFGHSEEVVGRALAEKPNKAVVATKLGLNWKDEKPFRDSTPARIRKEVEDSLRRLRVETIDLEQIHWPDDKTPIEDAARELQKLHQEGKIRALGVSNFSPRQMDIFREVAPLSTIQPPFNLFERTIEKDILPYAKKHDAVVLAYGALCRGLLTGKMNSETTFPKSDLRSADPKFQSPNFANYLAAVDGFKKLADARGKSVMAFAVRWVLDQGPVIALWGARKPEQVSGINDAFGWSLTDDEKKAVDDILARHVPNAIDPTFMAPPERD
ncbi:aldo/keto reductase [Gluconobacter wancherniae]|uniref:Oxidoreductase n=1 Tax=Gluconobacter wancherniae NBRC 103581 TaxID=656744 RepID=A0A511AW95_9PROT|nr:aldo/keto reductase [Gluconobacter wancherniae]MBF0852676.1 aldo/keto reductase [Gluconobacter wancherniae]MBS1061980.1 aldo/keto reductase [Gluconobacter wancherniae]MBS1093246.1 aldo/keto reductase [Gluconobacter wancherniae]GBD56612.1 oxidoreductase [Gluconobacter wancherniae NBRC 103581]GBR64207.1 aldo/keto reductase [Gluconobacter wancherniae NBRC 103581]